MSQTAVAEQAVAQAGMKADAGFDHVISRLAEGALYYGRCAVLGTDPERQAVHPDAAAEITAEASLLGVVIQSHAQESQAGSAAPSYVDKAAVPLMRRGVVYVKVEEAVTPSDPVYVRYAAGGNGIGSFGKTAGTTERALVPNGKMRYLSSAAADGLAKLEVSLG